VTAAGLDLAATRQFIELVYPATITGKLHISSTGDYAGQQFDRADVDGLTGYVRQLDQADKQSIYLRATTDRPGLAAGRRGGAADSVELVGLWSDLDFGQAGHNHDPSQHGGLVLPPDGQAAAKIVEKSQLPKPTVWIHSGGGLYGWWLLYVPFTLTDDSRADVGGLSKRWQAVLAAGAASLGFHYGTGVSDLARVLRLPGTVNRKVPGDPRPCHILSDNGPRYSLEVLTSACDAAERALANAQQNRQAVTGPVRATAEQFMQGDASKPWAPVAPGTGSPFDDFETRTDWADILCPHGWEEESRHSGGVTRYWRRPGKGEGDGHSATTGHAADRDRMFNFSDHAGLPTLESMTKQRVYALLNHHGDMKAAAAELYARGHGARRVETVSLADDTDFWTERKVLTHIRDFALSRLVSPWGSAGLRAGAGHRRHFAPGGAARDRRWCRQSEPVPRADGSLRGRQGWCDHGGRRSGRPRIDGRLQTAFQDAQCGLWPGHRARLRALRRQTGQGRTARRLSVARTGGDRPPEWAHETERVNDAPGVAPAIHGREAQSSVRGPD
jgi:hypothetical protein